MEHKIRTLHQLVESKNLSGLNELLDQDIAFYTPAILDPLIGKDVVAPFLAAALNILVNETFRYTRDFIGDSSAVLEFESTVDGVQLNGVDILHWTERGKIDEFRVMVRPVEAAAEFVRRVHEDAVNLMKAAN